MQDPLSSVRHHEVSLWRRNGEHVLCDAFTNLLIGRPVHVIGPIEGTLVHGLNNRRVLRWSLLVVFAGSFVHSLLLRGLLSL